MHHIMILLLNCIIGKFTLILNITENLLCCTFVRQRQHLWVWDPLMSIHIKFIYVLINKLCIIFVCLVKINYTELFNISSFTGLF